eukprot:364597-Chlamydomonas_euryale.AAC.14
MDGRVEKDWPRPAQHTRSCSGTSPQGILADTDQALHTLATSFRCTPGSSTRTWTANGAALPQACLRVAHTCRDRSAAQCYEEGAAQRLWSH